MKSGDEAPLCEADINVDGDHAVLLLSAAVEAPVGRTTADGIPLSQILTERPDVFAAYFTEFYGPNNDRHSDAWMKRVGGLGIEDYANYWYENWGKAEGYGGRQSAPVEVEDPLDIDRLFLERPDVFRSFFTEYYGANNDRHSSAWADRVGAATPEAYARYWYDNHGRFEGYSQRPPAAPTPEEPAPQEPAPDQPVAVEPDPIVPDPVEPDDVTSEPVEPAPVSAPIEPEPEPTPPPPADDEPAEPDPLVPDPDEALVVAAPGPDDPADAAPPEAVIVVVGGGFSDPSFL